MRKLIFNFFVTELDARFIVTFYPNSFSNPISLRIGMIASWSTWVSVSWSTKWQVTIIFLQWTDSLFFKYETGRKSPHSPKRCKYCAWSWRWMLPTKPSGRSATKSWNGRKMSLKSGGLNAKNLTSSNVFWYKFDFYFSIFTCTKCKSQIPKNHVCLLIEKFRYVKTEMLKASNERAHHSKAILPIQVCVLVFLYKFDFLLALETLLPFRRRLECANSWNKETDEYVDEHDLQKV